MLIHIFPSEIARHAEIPMSVHSNRIGGLILLVFSVAYAYLTTKIPLLPFQANAAFTAKTLPEVLSVMGVVLSLILIISPGEDTAADMHGYRWGRAAIICLMMVIYGLVIRSAGFVPSTIVFLMGGFLVLGERRWTMMWLTAVILVVLFWLLMTQVLNVYISPWPEVFSDAR